MRKVSKDYGNVGKKDYKKAKTSQRSDVKLNGRKEERDGAKDLDRIEGAIPCLRQ